VIAGEARASEKWADSRSDAMARALLEPPCSSADARPYPKEAFMISNRLSLVAAGVLVLAVGCASDPNKKVESSEADLTAAQQKARDDQAELDRKQAAERAKNQNMDSDKLAEQQRTHASDQAGQTSDSKQDISGGVNKANDAQANMDRERRDFDSKVEERMKKADARAIELKTKSAKLGKDKATKFNAYQKVYTQAKTDADMKVKSLKSASDDNWSGTKKEVEDTLDRMEKALDKMDQSF
jgi:hypothetical protein